jgi:hypothetical protein
VITLKVVSFPQPEGPHPDDFSLEGTVFLRLEKKPLKLSKRLAVEVWQVERRITRGDERERGGSRETRFRRRAAAGSIFLITDSRSIDLELPTQLLSSRFWGANPTNQP